MRKKTFYKLKLLLFTLMVIPLHAQSKNLTRMVTLSINGGPNLAPYVTNSGDGFHQLLAKELYARLGYSIVINSTPSERGLRNLNDGIDDGALPRIDGLSKYYPNIVQMNEAATEWQFAAFSKRGDIHLENWDDFAPYHVAIVTGWKIFEHNIKHYKSLTKVREASQLFQLLMSDRVDVIAYARLPGQSMISALGMDGIHLIKPVLATKKMYFYVNKKHQKLIPNADIELKRIKTEGVYQRLFKIAVSDKSLE